MRLFIRLAAVMFIVLGATGPANAEAYLKRIEVERRENESYPSLMKRIFPGCKYSLVPTGGQIRCMEGWVMRKGEKYNLVVYHDRTLVYYEERQAPTNMLIVPGVSIGDLVLGKSLPVDFIDKVSSRYPSALMDKATVTNQPPLDVYRWVEDKDESPIQVELWKGKVIKVIIGKRRKEHPDYKTAQGIGIGSSFSQLKAAYPHGILIPAGNGSDSAMVLVRRANGVATALYIFYSRGVVTGFQLGSIADE